MAQAAVSTLAQMTGKSTNGAVVVMEPQGREVLAMVGSADFNNAAISGQVNMALTDRPPARQRDQTADLRGGLEQN